METTDAKYVEAWHERHATTVLTDLQPTCPTDEIEKWGKVIKFAGIKPE